MKSNAKFISIYSFIILIFLTLTVVNSFSEINFFDIATEKYTNNDNEGAIQNLEKHLEIYPNDTKAKSLLGLCLTEMVAKYYDKSDYTSALPYMEKLIKLFPDDIKIMKMYINARKLVEKKGGIALSSEEIEELFSLLDKPISEQEELLSQYEGQQKVVMETVLTQAKKVRDQLKQRFKEREEATLRTVIKTNIFSVIAIIVLLSITIFFFFIYIHRYNIRREQVMLSSYEKIIDKLQPMLTTIIDKKVEISEFPKILSNTNSENKIHGIEVIEAELVPETDREVAERLLVSFIEDNDPKVKLRALLALYRYNPKKSIDKIRVISRDNNPELRVYCAQILGQIHSESSVKLLLEMRNEQEERVQREILKSIYEIYETKKNEFSQNLKSEIEKFLKEAESKWVFK